MAIYNDNDYKFVAVLNKKIEIPRLLNALGHISVGLTSLVEDTKIMEFLKYEDADGGAHPAISKFPFIVLSSDNSNKIRTLRNAAIEQGILYNDFTSSMLGFSAENQLQQTQTSKEEELEYFAICLFGKAEILNALTKKFSLFK
ncbi:MAG: hypothetical protein RLZZ292_3699 [Bacteroidota bacterium]|jgi:hypothetical protein